MYEKIVVPLDGSDLAEKALPYAIELAGKLGSALTLVNVRRPSENPDHPEHGEYINRMVEMTEHEVKKSASLPELEKVKVGSAIIGASGLLTHPAEELLDYAETNNIDLIVMATHGRTGIKRWAIGSTAEKIARVSKCPVLLVRANNDLPQNVRLDKILVTLDGSLQSEKVLPHIENIAPKLEATIYLLYVVEIPYHVYPVFDNVGYYGDTGLVRMPYTEEELKPIKETAEKYIKGVNQKLKVHGVRTSYKLEVGPASEGIIKAEEEIGVDMVVMSAHGHSGFGRWDHGGIADKVLHGGNKPLLLVRSQ